ncbi:MAG: sugar phosphate nucleotidyltransferase [Longimicrobiales bacterium]|nr:sugar phosphate nucleotidyltransferase [Longimicrobiales bacterium]
MNFSTDDDRPGEVRRWVAILAGGIGARFWPMSTPTRPKQLLPLVSDRPLIRDTIDRALGLAPPDRIRILTTADLVAPFRSVIGELPDGAYVTEPRARGTAPVLARIAWAIARTDPDAVLVSLHADHRIAPESNFHDLVDHASRIAARTGDLLTIGVRPDRAERGYGYIQPGAKMGEAAGTIARRVDAFHEKPGPETVHRYLEEGYLWNTGVFVWRVDRFLEEIGAHAPSIAGAFVHLERGDIGAYFDAVPSISVDHAVLERSDRVAVVEATFEWDDVGSWEALARTRTPDAAGNVTLGEVFVSDSERCIVATEDDPVVLFGVEDLVVVRAAGVTLVTSRERAGDLKDLLAGIPDAFRDPQL